MGGHIKNFLKGNIKKKNREKNGEMKEMDGTLFYLQHFFCCIAIKQLLLMLEHERFLAPSCNTKNMYRMASKETRNCFGESQTADIKLCLGGWLQMTLKRFIWVKEMCWVVYKCRLGITNFVDQNNWNNFI